MKKDLAAALAYVDSHQEKFIDELLELVRQPSISTQNIGVRECADLVCRHLQQVGVEAKVYETALHPIVVGERQGKRRDMTVLLYGHYDVQPPEPLDLWISPPFEPEIRNGRIHGRGSADDKGQFFTHIKAVEAWLAAADELPINVKFIFEGEEEIGSPNLSQFIDTHRELLAADLMVGADGNVHPSGCPEIALGMKGMLYVELIAKGAKFDVHCGRDPIVPNPAWQLVWALSTLRDPSGRIAIEGFYDDVLPPSRLDLEAIDKLPFDTFQRLDGYAINSFVDGVIGAEANKRLVLWPTCSIDGIYGGYMGAGSKTIIPREARAKVAMRLVPDQRSEDILAKLRSHLDSHGFSDIGIEVQGGVFEPSKTPLDMPYLPALIDTCRDVYGCDPLVFPMFSTGGSGPDANFGKVLGVHTAWIPCAQFKDKNAHSPNESITVEGFMNGIRVTTNLLARLAQVSAMDNAENTGSGCSCSAGRRDAE